jgi:hypothetical protein
LGPRGVQCGAQRPRGPLQCNTAHRLIETIGLAPLLDRAVIGKDKPVDGVGIKRIDVVFVFVVCRVLAL